MPDRFFEDIFRNMVIPVIVCMDNERLDIVYENAGAKMLLNPLLPAGAGDAGQALAPLGAVLRFESGSFEEFCRAAGESRSLPGYVAVVLSFEDEPTPVSISCSAIEYKNRSYRVLYIRPSTQDSRLSPGGDALLTAFQLSHSSRTTEDAIQNVLSFAGGHADVSRAYIFEEASAGATSCTYEWCAAGVEPGISELQNLPKAVYSYDELVRRGLYITDDIRKLAAPDRAILERQGVKSLAIIPMLSKDAALGYIGFDDCESCRRWSMGDITFLKGLAGILASLLERRNMERGQSLTLQMLQTITNSSNSIVYVSDISTHELVFINRAMAEYIGKPAEELLGKPCWQVLHSGNSGPCEYCRLKDLLTPGGPSCCEWEHKSTGTGKWYRIHNSLVKWNDGRDMHLSTLTEITSQKENEERLELIASRDMMTGVYNRAWGYQLISNMLASHISGESNSLVFIDLDGLKYVNDTYGHDEGDQFIISVVGIIQSNVRKSDVLFRWGGDEFILVLRCGAPQAEIIMDNIRHAMDTFNAGGAAAFKLGFSYGVVPLESDGGHSVDDIISGADKLMYVNKTSKRRFRAE